MHIVRIKRTLEEKLEIAKLALETFYLDDDSKDLNARYSKTSLEAKSLRI